MQPKSHSKRNAARQTPRPCRRSAAVAAMPKLGQFRAISDRSRNSQGASMGHSGGTTHRTPASECPRRRRMSHFLDSLAGKLSATINAPDLRLAPAPKRPTTRSGPPHPYLTTGLRPSQDPGVSSYESGANETNWNNGPFSAKFLRVPRPSPLLPAPLYGP